MTGPARIQVARDSGYGHRCITHDRTNPYCRVKEPEAHAAWETGWVLADRDLMGCER